MSGYIVDVVALGGIYTLFTLGLTLSWGVLNILNLAHGSVFMAGALSAYRITEVHPYPLYIVLPLTMILSGAAVVALEVLAFKPIRRRAESEHDAEIAIVIASIGASGAMVAAAWNYTAGHSVSISDTSFQVESYEIFGVGVTNIELIIVGLAIGLTSLLAWFVAKTRHGRALKTLASDPYMAGLLGISSGRLALGTMFVSGALAGMSGVLLAIHLNTAGAHMGDSLLLKAFAAIILGGIGSISGAAIGSFILASAEIATVVYLGSSLRDSVAFILIILLLVLRPEGLLSKGSWQRT